MIVTGPLDPATGAVLIPIGAESHLPWHEVAISITDDLGAPLDPATGTMTGETKGVGADKFVSFTETLDLVAGDRRWIPFFSIVNEFKITPIGMPANSRYIVTIINTRS